MTNLIEELARAAGNIRDSHLHHLVGLGVSGQAMVNIGADFGVDRPNENAAWDAATPIGPDAETISHVTDKILEDLAKLSPIEYDQMREARAEVLGVRVSVLDAEVKKLRPKNENGGSGRALSLPEPEPWPEPVDGDFVVVHFNCSSASSCVMLIPPECSYGPRTGQGAGHAMTKR